MTVVYLMYWGALDSPIMNMNVATIVARKRIGLFSLISRFLKDWLDSEVR